MAERSMGRDDRKEKRRSVKQKIRDTKRLLSKEDLPETVRLTKERMLRCLATELEEKQQESRDKKMNKKYRMVKFFDKRKVLRRLKVLQKEWSACTDATERCALLCSLEQLRKELNYVVHFPATEKYLALYPSTDSTDDHARVKKGQMLQQVADMVNSGELSDASSPLLQPALLAQLTSHHSPDTDRTLPSLSGGAVHPLRQESASDCGSPVVPQTLSGAGRNRKVKQNKGECVFRRSRKRVYTAAVDEEPEVDANVVMSQSKRQLAAEDDFFLQY